MPLDVVDVDQPEAAALYARSLVLVRPDGHVAWRGDALPGDTSEEHIARILSDVASLAYKWKKPLAARLLPVPGKKAGDRTAFTDSRMANTVIH